MRNWVRSPSWFGHDVDAFVDEVFGRDTRRTSAWWPRVETFAKDGAVQVRCDVPGVDPKDIDVSLEGDTLTIRGERKVEQERSTYREVAYGRFERSLTVPEGLDAEKITARYENGVLHVILPVQPAALPRKVTVQVDGPKPASEAQKAA